MGQYGFACWRLSVSVVLSSVVVCNTAGGLASGPAAGPAGGRHYMAGQ